MTAVLISAELQAHGVITQVRLKATAVLSTTCSEQVTRGR
jgi:hypothetical protein